jgi:ribose transport system substrate-binding protein
LTRNLRRFGALGLSALAVVLVAACNSSPASTSTAPGGASAPSSDFVATAKTKVANDYKGTNSAPDTTLRKPTAGKKLVVISAGESSLSSSVPSDAAVEAAKAAGWNVTLYDEKLNPANAPALVRQAIAGGAEGIILDATDCPLVKETLQEAKAKNIKIVPIYAFDCNDPIFGGGDPLFSGFINYGTKASNVDTFTESYGADQADAVIAQTKGQAKVILFNDTEFTVLKYTAKGFTDELAKCSGCSIVTTVDFKAAELGPALQQKAASILLQHPEANAVKIPYTAAALLGISPAIAASSKNGSLYVMGGEGFAPELDLIRANKGVTAVNVIASDWVGWAAVDTMNSLFLGTPPADSGIGWTLADATHNIPASGPYVASVDFKAAYKKAWGLS